MGSQGTRRTPHSLPPYTPLGMGRPAVGHQASANESVPLGAGRSHRCLTERVAWSWTSAAIAALIDSEFGLLTDLQRTVRFCDDDHSTQGDDDLEYAHYVSLFPLISSCSLFPCAMLCSYYLLPTRRVLRARCYVVVSCMPAIEQCMILRDGVE